MVGHNISWQSQPTAEHQLTCGKCCPDSCYSSFVQFSCKFTNSYKTKNRQVKKLKKFNHASHLITLPNIENLWNHLFELIHRDIIANGQPVISIASEYESMTNIVTFTIAHKTPSEVTLQYYTNYKKIIKGWNLLVTEPATLKNSVADAKKRFQQLQ